MGTPANDPKIKARALDRAGHAAAKRAKADDDELVAIRLASLCGNSTRDIARATGRSHATVARLLQRPARELNPQSPIAEPPAGPR